MDVRTPGGIVAAWWKLATRWERAHALLTVHVALFFGLWFIFSPSEPVWFRVLVTLWPLQGTAAVVWGAINRADSTILRQVLKLAVDRLTGKSSAP